MTTPAPLPPLSERDALALARVQAQVLGLPLSAEYEPGTASNLTLAYRLAGTFLPFPLSDEAEPAPVYRVVEQE